GTLLAIAVIAFGAALLLGSAEIVDIGSLAGPAAPERSFRAASGTQALVGGTAVVLGIIALASTDRLTLDLVALLAGGGGALLSSAAIAGLLARAGRRA